MGRLLLEITMTLDGYVAGPNQSAEHPLGEGAEGIHDWALPTSAFREIHGRSGGERGVNDEVIREVWERTGATIMGRNMFGGGPGPWDSGAPWNGWWGDEPPFHQPVFVLTHHPREPLEMAGGTTFHFVTEGIEAALEQALEGAGNKDVHLSGGAQAANQYLAAGLVDEVHLHVVPKLLGGGERLFEGLGGSPPELLTLGTIEGPGVSHLRYETVRG